MWDVQYDNHVCFLFRTVGHAGAIAVSGGTATFEGETSFVGNSAGLAGGE